MWVTASAPAELRRTLYRVDRRPERPGLGYTHETSEPTGSDPGPWRDELDDLAVEASFAYHTSEAAFDRFNGRVLRGAFNSPVVDPPNLRPLFGTVTP